MSTPFPTINESLQAKQGTEPNRAVPAVASTPPAKPLLASHVVLPAKGPLLTRSGWSAFMVALIAVCAVAPVLNLWVPEGHALHMSTYAVALLGKIMCYAIAALGLDLIWVYTGIL